MNGRPGADIVLTRLIGYLQLAGIAVDDTLLFELADIVRQGCESGQRALFDWSLAQLNGRLVDTTPPVAAPMPPLRRASIGYDTPRHDSSQRSGSAAITRR